MIDWFSNMTLKELGVGLFLAFSFSFVMFMCLKSIFGSKYLGWYGGLPSSPVFQVIMWVGALPFVVPAVVIYFKRKNALKNAKFIGNIRSRIFHVPECEYQRKIHTNFLRYPLKSKEVAEKQGFRKCNWCVK